MGAIRFPSARRTLLVAAGLLIAGPGTAAPLVDGPVPWYADDARDIDKPSERDPSLLWDGPSETVVRPFTRLTHPGRAVRRVGTWFGGDPVRSAVDMNALDEALNSSWFTNRIGLFPLDPASVGRGPGTGEGPDRSAPWTVIGGKTQGVTPGFRIRDAAGDVFLIKFDPPEFPGMASAAAVISGRLLHAAGYHVPEDDIVNFRREDLTLGEGVRLTLPDGSKRDMTAEDLDRILEQVGAAPDGRYRAIASRFLDGEPVGPFDWQGRRGDDPNDRIRHEDRRELRGLRVIAGWIDHFDTKQHNTLDVHVEEAGRRYLRHHLIDFASSLGAGATGPEPAYGFEYSIDPPAILGRGLALGIHEDSWRRLERPVGLEEIGYFESTYFDPLEFKPLTPNASFANLTDRDGYWAAKIISAFTDQHLAAAVAAGHYRNPDAAAYMVATLAGRRDRIARTWFDRVPPLDFFRFQGGEVRFRDLGGERGIYPGTKPRYRWEIAAATADRGTGAWTPAEESETPVVPDILDRVEADPGTHPFVALRVRVDRGSGWSDAVTAYLSRRDGHVVAVER